jgi:hypothetical protein
MQRSAATPTQGAAPFFSSLFGGGGGSNSNSNANNNQPTSSSPKSPARSRPPTSLGEPIAGGSPRQTNTLLKDRKPSFGGRKLSFNFASSPGKSTKRRPDSPTANGGGTTPSGFAHPPPAIQLFPDTLDPPPTEPIARSPASPSGFSKMLSRGAVTPISAYPVQLGAVPTAMLGISPGQPSELSSVHQHIQDTASKRISTLEYLRKA